MQVFERLITIQKAANALKSMTNNKAPGSDGLSKEFFVKFWNLLGIDLVDVFNSAYVASSLTETFFKKSNHYIVTQERGKDRYKELEAFIPSEC